MALVVFQAVGSIEPMDFLKVVASVFGVIVSMPVLVAVFRTMLFVGQMKNTVDTTAETLTKFTEKVEQVLEDHSKSLTDVEVKVKILWDGQNRRSGKDRREGEAHGN